MAVVVYKDVRREKFEKLSQLSGVETEYFSAVTVYYNGTNLKGDIRIDVSAGETKIYNKFIELAAKVIAGTYKD